MYYENMTSFVSDHENGAKAYNLHRLQQIGITVPAFAVVADTEYDSLHEKAKGLRFPLIIRSSASIEDQKGQSFAGVFHSAKVDTWHELDKAFAKLQILNEASQRGIAERENKDADYIRINYIVQEFKQAVRGGVAHIPQHGDSIIEMGTNPDEVTSGSIKPIRGTIALDGGQRHREQWQQELADIARMVRREFDGDQEIEWLEDAKGDVYVVQVRPFGSATINVDKLLRRERNRLRSSYQLHQGAYDTSFLPDIAAPTPLTVELMSDIYTQGLIDQRKARKNSQPVVTIAGNMYVDAAAYRRSWPIVTQLQQSKVALDAYQAFKTNRHIYPNKNTPDTVVGTWSYICQELSPVIFRNTQQVQAVRTILMRKLGLSASDPTLLPLSTTPLEEALKNQSRAEITKHFWYIADNEYELSEPRLFELHVHDRDKLIGTNSTNKTATKRARKELLQTFMSVFDETYYRNLFQLYDFLCHRRAVLHDQLIESIAVLRRQLLAMDNDLDRHNLLWYATYDEIKQAAVPSTAVLQQRRDDWQSLQTLPLTHPNRLRSWDDFDIAKSYDHATIIKGEELSAGLVHGRIGVDVQVVTSLTHGVLARRRVTAIITERGGSLSHVAILARERHIAIIRIDNATNLFRTGDNVIVDTKQGRVSVATKQRESR